MSVFEEKYNHLNQAQKEAVDSIYGPVIVLAGPGTGKTQILTLRIANILRLTDTPAEAILAITFTESGVVAMRKRLATIIGATAYKVNIKTFHGFANELIISNPDIFSHLASRLSLTDVDQISLLESIFLDNFFSEIKPQGDPLLYLYDAKQAIDTLKREGISPHDFKKIVAEEQEICKNSSDRIHEKGAHKGKVKKIFLDWEKWIRRNQELAFVYENYVKICENQNLYDFADMIMEVDHALKNNENFRYSIQELYQFFLIDEHQDTNNAQNSIIETICSYDESPNLFIVGDEKQAIFRFQGASLENFKYFTKKFAKSKVIFLSENYRSSQNILDASHHITPSQTKLKSNQEHNAEINLAEFQREDSELRFITDDIKNKISSGVAPNNIAIIYRKNRDADLIIKNLESQSINYCVNSNRDVLDDHRIRSLIDIFRIVCDPDNDEALVNALHANFTKIDGLSILKLIRHCTANKTKIIDIINSKNKLAEIEVAGLENIHRLGESIIKWHQLSFNTSLLNCFEIILYESGFINFANSSNDAIQLHEKLTLLFDLARSITERKPRAKLNDFIEKIEVIKKHKLRLKYVPLIKNGVQLMTAHASKGLEFEYVYILHASDNIWGSAGRASKFHLPAAIFNLDPLALIDKHDEDISDEQNLFYVAMTRAKKEVTISFYNTKSDGKELIASQFISKIDPVLINHIKTSEYDNFKMLNYVDDKPVDDLKSYINELLDKQGLNVSALNNFIECPWKYLYVNLLRLPQAPTTSTAFGTAIHATLDFYFKDITTSTEELLREFNRNIERQPLNEVEIKELKDKGFETVQKYIEHYKNTWKHRTINELLVPTIHFDEDTFLRGQIDMIELNNDDNSIDDKNFYSGPVSVFDFKTGKPKTRSSIEKNSGENYKYFRQLVFYKLLLDEFRNGAFNMELGYLDFIETDDKDNFHREAFTITLEDKENLKNEIRQAIKSIRDFAFWNTKCEDASCKYCELGANLKDSLPKPSRE